MTIKPKTEGRSSRIMLEGALREYETSGKKVPFDFRQNCRAIAAPLRHTHLLHPYPSKLVAHIPNYLLKDDVFCPTHGTIYDPFCGSGTVLLEGALAGRKTIGAEINPLGRLVASVKLTRILPHDLKKTYQQILKAIPTVRPLEPPDVVNISYWFHPHVIKKLCILCAAITKVRNPDLRQFFLVGLSACVREVSLADPRVAVPVRLRPERYPIGHPMREQMEQRLRQLKCISVFKVFGKKVERNIAQMDSLCRSYDSLPRFACSMTQAIWAQKERADPKLRQLAATRWISC